VSGCQADSTLRGGTFTRGWLEGGDNRLLTSEASAQSFRKMGQVPSDLNRERIVNGVFLFLERQNL